MSAILRARQELQKERSRKFAFDSFFVFGVAQSIQKFPGFAAHADDELLHKHETIDVCVAISHEGRLYLPVVHNANMLPIEDIQAEIERLVDKARAGHLGSSDLARGCFTVSNLGMYPIDSFQMIIPPDQIAALAIGAMQERPVVENGQVVVRPMCTIALSVDHRPVNGAEAAAFLKHLKETLEQL
jgi:pyruvate/2-oxoglutarate dehydrogenase complex dihydrolipoamide acyltransferase (E2) component